MMMPFVILFIGIMGAFVTTSWSSASMLIEESGYRFVSQRDPCHQELNCAYIGTTVCTSGSQNLYAKVTPSANVCDIPLYKMIDQA